MDYLLRVALPNEVEEIESIFQKKGAYSKFKILLGRKGVVDKWYAFESQEQEKALREWCKEIGIEVDG